MYMRQRGATFLGMAIIVAIVGAALYAGIRLTPIYMEYMAVARALEQTAEEADGEATNIQKLRIELERRWTIEDIMSIDAKDIDIKKNDRGFIMRAEYRAEAPFAGNVSLAVDFNKSVQVNQ